MRCVRARSSSIALQLYNLLSPCPLRRPVKRVFFRCISSTSHEAGAPEVEQQALVTSTETNSNVISDAETGTAEPKKKGMWEVMRISIVFCPIWFVANWAYNESLVLTTVSSATILASSSPLFTLLFTSLLGVRAPAVSEIRRPHFATQKERFTLLKLLAVCLTICGVVLVTVTDAERKKPSELAASPSTPYGASSNSTETPAPPPSRGATVLGDMLSLLSAVAYGVYATALDRMIPDHRVVSTPMFFGFVGALNALLLWPVGILLSLVGVERFVMPSSEEALALVANGLVGTVVSDLLWLWSVLLTSPLITTVGISLTVPLAVTSDVVLHGDRFAWQYLLGSGLVLMGFVAVTVHDRLHAFLLALLRRHAPWCPGIEERASLPSDDAHSTTPQAASDVSIVGSET